MFTEPDSSVLCNDCPVLESVRSNQFPQHGSRGVVHPAGSYEGRCEGRQADGPESHRSEVEGGHGLLA